jgi:hypothetical protein
MTEWKAEYFGNGGPNPRHDSGWYCTRWTLPESVPAGCGMRCEFRGPFPDEAAARARCGELNAAPGGKP